MQVSVGVHTAPPAVCLERSDSGYGSKSIRGVRASKGVAEKLLEAKCIWFAF